MGGTGNGRRGAGRGPKKTIGFPPERVRGRQQLLNEFVQAGDLLFEIGDVSLEVLLLKFFNLLRRPEPSIEADEFLLKRLNERLFLLAFRGPPFFILAQFVQTFGKRLLPGRFFRLPVSDLRFQGSDVRLELLFTVILLVLFLRLVRL